MKKEYNNAVRCLFKKKLKENKLDLVKCKPSYEFLMPGERVYKVKIGTLSCFVFLIPHRMVDKFTLEIGWSECNDFPNITSRPSGILSADKKELKNTDFVVRIGDLIDGTDFWWTIEETGFSLKDVLKSLKKVTKEEAERKVLPHVENAIDRIQQYVLPFFQDLAASKLKPV